MGTLPQPPWDADSVCFSGGRDNRYERFKSDQTPTRACDFVAVGRAAASGFNGYSCVQNVARR